MNQIRGRLPGQCLIALRQLPGAGTVSLDHGVAVPHASGPAKRSRRRSSMISATASGTNLAHEGSEARMRRRISVPEVTLILSGTDRPRVSVGKPCSLSRLTFSSFHSFTRVVKQTEPGGTNSCRSEEHTSELQSLMRISYAVFCLKKKKQQRNDVGSPYNKQRVQTTHRRHITNAKQKDDIISHIRRRTH